MSQSDRGPDLPDLSILRILPHHTDDEKTLPSADDLAAIHDKLADLQRQIDELKAAVARP